MTILNLGIVRFIDYAGQIVDIQCIFVLLICCLSFISEYTGSNDHNSLTYKLEMAGYT